MCVYMYLHRRAYIIYIYIYRRADTRYIYVYIHIKLYPNLLQFAAYGQFVLVTLRNIVTAEIEVVTNRN